MNSKKFMKSLAIILSAANVLSAAAFAEAVQTGENSVKITGNIGKAEVCDYTIDVYAPGKTWADINKDFGATNTDVLVYHNQLETDKDGNYIVEFDMEGKSGEYQILVYSEKTGIDDSQTLIFRDAGDFKLAIEELNDIAADKTKTSDDFIEYITKNSVILDFSFDALKEYDEEDALEILYNQVKETPFDTEDMTEPVRKYRQACIIAGLNSGKVSDVFDYSEYFAEDVKNLGKYLDEESAGLVLTQTMRTGATKKIKDAKCNTVNEFLDKTAEAVVLEAVKSPNGVENLKKVLDDFEYATGISGDDYKTAELNAVIGSSFDSIEDLEDALDEAGSKPSTGQVSRPSGGSGGGGGSASGGRNVEVTKPIDNEDTSSKAIADDIYVDIEGVVWAKNAIIGLTEKGVVNGKTIDTFAPDDIVTREEFAKILVMAFAKDAEPAEVSFADVDRDEWYFEYLAKAVGAGLMMGHSDDIFGVGEPISRQDIATALYRAVYQGGTEAEYELEFTDTELISDYALEAVKILCKDGIINGMGDNSFCPTENATRAQAAKMVYEILER